jgi:predicted alpha/beta superfamily hydrolase
MNCIPTVAIAAALAGSLVTPLRAQDAPPDRIPSHDSITLSSRSLGEARHINVHVPRSYSASRSSRFPVLYMPDGGLDEDFAHVVNTVDSLIALGAIRPVIVVGVPNTERRRDLTGPTRVKSDSAIAPHVGGSAAFRRFFGDELVPAIDARYRTTRERSIVGESLAGLFIVETFLREPTMFDHYIAFDPSMWWNRAGLVDSASALLRAFPSATEQKGRTLPKQRTFYFAASRDAIGDETAVFADALHTAARRDVLWTFAPRPDLTHATIFRALAPSALASALR